MIRRFFSTSCGNSNGVAVVAPSGCVFLQQQCRQQSSSSPTRGSGDSDFEYISPRDIIDPKNSYVGKLMAPRTPFDKTPAEMSWRAMRAQPHFFEIPVRTRQPQPWQRAREDWYGVETKLIWAAFEAPERIPVLLRDEVIRGHRAVFEDPRWLDRALYWVKEARYWRAIGITKPFYDRDTLRAYAWANRGTAFGQPVINSAMRDAISDLERAKKRKDAGLDPNYIWDRWGPSGFVDGKRSDYLPRFSGNPYIDPDGVEVEADELAHITSHEQIRDRYGEFIWGDEAPFANSFSTLAAAQAAVATVVAGSGSNLTNGGLQIHDFRDGVRAFYYSLHLGPALPESAGIAEVQAREEAQSRITESSDDIRCLIYCSTQLEPLQPKFEDFLEKTPTAGGGNKWEAFKEFLAPIRQACDEKVDSCRLLHWCSRDVEQARQFFMEKCNFVDFMMTSDKVLTAASLCQLRAIKAIAASTATEWGLPLCLSVTDKEKEEAIGVDAFAVWREFEDLCLDRSRRIFTQRFSEPASEEKTLDHLLTQFARRPNRTDRDPNALGAEYDREVEPIGRTVQRRVLSSDVVNQSGAIKRTGPAGEKKDDTKRSKFSRFGGERAVSSAYDALRRNQFASEKGKF